jgi:hypothetical protein
LTVTPFGDAFTGGVRVAAADVNRDGVDDLITGTGPGAATAVRVFDGATGQELVSLAPFETAFVGGVYVAAADLDGDRFAEIVVTPDEGGGPVVVAYSGAKLSTGLTGDAAQLVRFLGIEDPAFRGGARPALGDVDGNGTADLVVAAGFLGGPRVAVFDGRTVATGTPTRLASDFFAFEPGVRNGVYVAAADLDGDGFAEVIAGGGPGGGPRVAAFSGRGLLTGSHDTVADFFAGDPGGRGGVRVAAKDLNVDGRAELVTGAAADSKVSTYQGADWTADTDPFPDVATGVFVG